MANFIYQPYVNGIMSNGPADLLTLDIKAVLLDTAVYTPSDQHEFLNEITGVVATSTNLATKAISPDGTFDCGTITFANVTGATVESFALFIDTGNASTSRMIVYRDTGVTGLPATPGGGNITIAVPSGIFSLGQ